jgi:hypothetical protein
MTNAGSGSSKKGSWLLVPVLALVLAILLIGRCEGGSSSGGVAATSLPPLTVTPPTGRALPRSAVGSTTPIRVTLTPATLTAAVPVPPGPTLTEGAPTTVTASTTVTAGATVTANATVTATATVTNGTVTVAAPAPAPQPPAVDAGDLTANGTPLLPLAQAAPDGTLSRYAGQTVVAHRVLVQSAPVDKGFWVGTSAGNRIYVELVGHGLVYPHPIRAGDRVNFVGQMVANTQCFLNSTGLTVADGAGLLAAHRAHIAIPMSGVSFAN